MAESFGGNWWNPPENLFGRSTCSAGTTDFPSFDWPDPTTTIITDNKGTRSSDDSSGGISSSTTPPDDQNQEYFFNYSNMILPQIEQYPSNPISTSDEIFPLDSATALLLQALFDTEDSEQPPHGFLPTFQETSPMVHPPFADLTLPSTTQSQFNDQKRSEETRHVGPKKPGNEPALKRARIQTPSPLPTFKVRKEKLGDRVTALQQLVSPFGKTDTASVLQEAIEYIRFLHDQVNVLTSPNLKRVGQTTADRGGTQDLKSRGLCLGPISSTFPVTAETTVDFWTPIFREGSFK